MSESKMKPRLRAEELTGMISLLRDKFVRSENLRCCCFVPMRRNSVLDGLRSNLFIQERMSVKVVVSVSRHTAEFVGVKEMYSWVSSAYKWYLREFLMPVVKIPQIWSGNLRLFHVQPRPRHGLHCSSFNALHLDYTSLKTNDQL